MPLTVFTSRASRRPQQLRVLRSSTASSCFLRIPADRESEREYGRETECGIERERESARALPIGTSVCGLKINFENNVFIIFSLPLPLYTFSKRENTHTYSYTGQDHCAEFSNAAHQVGSQTAQPVSKTSRSQRCPHADAKP